MEVSFTLGAGQDVRTNQIASRVLTENLLRNDKIIPKFMNFPIISSYYTHKDIPKYMKQLTELNKTLGMCPSSWANMLKVSLGHYKYADLLLDEVKTEYLFYSCSLTMLEFKTISKILNAGIKLIIGGPLLDSFSFEEIRIILSKSVDSKYMKNLLIIKGYVDLTTDLYKILRDWKDYLIEVNDFSTFWDCKEDYIVDKTDVFRRFNKHFDLSFLNDMYPFKYSVFILDNYCWWSKCRFCLYPFFDKLDYMGNASVETVTNNIIDTMKMHKNEGIFFANDYFMFNDKYEKIMDNLVKNDIKICIFTGIKALQNKKYIDKVNKYVSAIKLGIESFSDFSLQYVRKGYTYEDIQDALNLIKDNMKRDVSFLSNLIIDLPAKSKEDIIESYERAARFRDEIDDAGFTFRYSSKILVINKDTKDQFIDNKYVMVNNKEENISGRYLLFKYFRELGIITDDLYKDMAVPLLRCDENGNELDTDFNILPYPLAKEIFTWN